MKLGMMNRQSRIGGFTLVELLITISLLAVLAMLVIPAVRLVSKGRQTRESSNFVGSALASAQSRAIADGLAGVLIQRNPNLKNGNGATRIFQVRAPRPFSGYGSNARAIVYVNPDITQPNQPMNPNNRTASIPAIPDSTLFNIGDYVQFNHRGAIYRVVRVAVDDIDSTRTVIEFEIKSIDPPLPEPPEPSVPGEPVEMLFTIFRRPVIVPSTLTDLPRGFMIDLEFSGHGSRGFQFFIDPPPTLADLLDPNQDFNVIILFNDRGGVELVYRDGWDSNPEIPVGPVSLLVAEYDVKLGNNALANAQQTLLNKRNNWVTVNRTNGIVSIGNMADMAVDPLVDKGQALSNSRSLSRSGISANQ